MLVIYRQDPHCTRKIGKMTKTFSVRKDTGNLDILPKYRANTGNVFAQVVNSLILKIQDIAIFTAKFSNIPLKLNVSAKSVLYMKTSQITWIGIGNFQSYRQKLGICK